MVQAHDRNRPTFRSFGTSSTKEARIRPKWVRSGAESTNIVSESAEFGPIPARFGPSSTRCGANSAETRSEVAGFRQHLA